MLKIEVKFFTTLQRRLITCFNYMYVQVIKNSRNVTRYRNGQSVKSRQTRWEWQLLISIMYIHDVVTRYIQYLRIPVCMAC